MPVDLAQPLGSASKYFINSEPLSVSTYTDPLTLAPFKGWGRALRVKGLCSSEHRPSNSQPSLPLSQFTYSVYVLLTGSVNLFRLVASDDGININ